MKRHSNEDAVGIALIIAILVTFIAVVAIIGAIAGMNQAHKASADVPVAKIFGEDAVFVPAG